MRLPPRTIPAGARLHRSAVQAGGGLGCGVERQAEAGGREDVRRVQEGPARTVADQVVRVVHVVVVSQTDLRFARAPGGSQGVLGGLGWFRGSVTTNADRNSVTTNAEDDTGPG